MAYEITAGMVLEAIQDGAREATLEMLKSVDFSTAAGQAQAKAVLDAIQLMLDSGDAKVQLTGTPEVTLTGTTVTIGGTEYRLLPDGNTLVGDSADEPDAAAAEAAIGDGVAYFAKDTRVLKTSDGTDWGPLL